MNKGDGVLGYEHPLSRTYGVLYMNSQTNVGLQGRWMYRVDGNNDTTSCSVQLNTGKCNIMS